MCCNDEPAMSGAHQGFTTQVKEVNQQVIILHGLFHWENLASQSLSCELETDARGHLSGDFIKARHLNSRFFDQMCSNFDSDLVHLLYHSEVRWLLQGKVLQRVMAPYDETEVFLLKTHPLAL